MIDSVNVAVMSCAECAFHGAMSATVLRNHLPSSMSELSVGVSVVGNIAAAKLSVHVLVLLVASC